MLKDRTKFCPGGMAAYSNAPRLLMISTPLRVAVSFVGSVSSTTSSVDVVAPTVVVMPSNPTVAVVNGPCSSHRTYASTSPGLVMSALVISEYEEMKNGGPIPDDPKKFWLFEGNHFGFWTWPSQIHRVPAVHRGGIILEPNV